MVSEIDYEFELEKQIEKLHEELQQYKDKLEIAENYFNEIITKTKNVTDKLANEALSKIKDTE